MTLVPFQLEVTRGEGACVRESAKPLYIAQMRRAVCQR